MKDLLCNSGDKIANVMHLGFKPNTTLQSDWYSTTKMVQNLSFLYFYEFCDLAILRSNIQIPNMKYNFHLFKTTTEF
jgi:hypothetical protein